MLGKGKIRFFILAATSFAVMASCSPLFFSVNVEMRYPSHSGMDLAGKSMAIVFLDSGLGRDSVFNEYLALGFAKVLEEDYFDGEETIGLYRVQKDMGRDYSQKDSLVDLIIETGEDVVFLFDSPDFGQVSLGEERLLSEPDTMVVLATVPFDISLYAYDSMDKADTVRVFRGHSRTQLSLAYAQGTDQYDIKSTIWDNLHAAGETTGSRAAARFLSQWKQEQYTIYYYYVGGLWDEASLAASELRWKDAMDLWMELLDTKNLQKMACLKYNIAVACHFLRQYELALEWLDSADKDWKVPNSNSLRKRILDRIGP